MPGKRTIVVLLAVAALGSPRLFAQSATDSAPAAQHDARPKLVIVGFEADPAGDARDAWIPLAIQELLTDRLRRVHTFLVVPTLRAYQSRRELRGSDTQAPPWPDVARTLGATHLLHGRCAGSGRQITLQLWLERLDATDAAPAYEALPPDRIFPVLDEATRWVLARFDVSDLPPEINERLFAAPSRSVSAVEYYVRALAAAREDNLREALRLANESVSNDSRFRPAQSLLGQIELRTGDFTNAIPRFRALAALVREAGDPLERADVELKQSLLSQVQGGFDAALTRAQTALQLALKDGDPYSQLAAIDLMCDLYVTRQPPPGETLSDDERAKFRHDNFAKAVETQRLLVALLDRLNDQIAILSATNKLALLYEQLDDFDAALETHRRTLAIAQALHSQRHEATAWMYIGQCLRKKKQWNEAVEAVNRCLSLAADATKPAVQIVLGNIYTDMDQPEEAIRQFDAAYEKLKTTDDLVNQLACLRESARACHKLGRNDEARKRLEQAIEVAHALELPEEQALRDELASW